MSAESESRESEPVGGRAEDRPARSEPVAGEAETRSARFTIGAEVIARDGECGQLIRVIVDPVARTLTHLVVAPKHHRAQGRLVPVDLIEADGDPVRLSCTTAHFHALDEAEESQFVPVTGDTWEYAGGQAYSWPYYGLGLVGGMGAGGMGEAEIGHHVREPVMSDRVPTGEVQVRRGDQVHATDGWIGSVQGLVIDPRDHHITHVLLEEGHLWGRKQVAIPIGAVSRVDEGVRVELTKEQVKDLPPVDLSSAP